MPHHCFIVKSPS